MKLLDIAEIKAGHPFRGKIPEVNSSNIKVLQMKDLSITNEIDWSSVTETEVLGKKEPDWLEADDILFSGRGARNNAYHLQSAPAQTVASPHLFRIHVSEPERILPEFLAWQINQKPAQKYFELFAEGSVVLNIRRPILENLHIKIPPIETQQKILNFHQCWLEEQRIYNKLIANREKQVTATVQKLLSQYD